MMHVYVISHYVMTAIAVSITEGLNKSHTICVILY